MQRQDHAVAPGDVAVEPLDLVGVDVRRRHLDRRRQVEDGPALRRRLPDVHHRLADLLGGVELGAGEAFGRVLEICKGTEEHTSELQSLMRTSYAVFCLNKKNRALSKSQHTQ